MRASTSNAVRALDVAKAGKETRASMSNSVGALDVAKAGRIQKGR